MNADEIKNQSGPESEGKLVTAKLVTAALVTAALITAALITAEFDEPVA
jgi:hypothetical protein